MKQYLPFFLLALVGSAQAQPQNGIPWSIRTRVFPGTSTIERECKYPLEVVLQNKRISWPNEFSGEFSLDYTDGSLVTVTAESCSMPISVIEVNERKGYRINYLIQPTETYLDTTYWQMENPPYDLVMMVGDRYTFR
jgi:hypothetical protein